jgi:hypothetical protein
MPAMQTSRRTSQPETRAAAKADREPHPEPKVPSVDRWLVDRGLAEHRDGELVATAEGLELGAVFE